MPHHLIPHECTATWPSSAHTYASPHVIQRSSYAARTSLVTPASERTSSITCIQVLGPTGLSATISTDQSYSRLMSSASLWCDDWHHSSGLSICSLRTLVWICSTLFGRPFVKRFALCYRSVVCLWPSCTVAKWLDRSRWNFARRYASALATLC